jgi:hypothetical protein
MIPEGAMVFHKSYIDFPIVWFKNSSEDNVPKTHHDFCTKHGKFHPRLEKHGMSEVVRL